MSNWLCSFSFYSIFTLCINLNFLECRNILYLLFCDKPHFTLYRKEIKNFKFCYVIFFIAIDLKSSSSIMTYKFSLLFFSPMRSAKLMECAALSYMWLSSLHTLRQSISNTTTKILLKINQAQAIFMFALNIFFFRKLTRSCWNGNWLSKAA